MDEPKESKTLIDGVEVELGDIQALLESNIQCGKYDVISIQLWRWEDSIMDESPEPIEDYSDAESQALLDTLSKLPTAALKALEGTLLNGYTHDYDRKDVVVKIETTIINSATEDEYRRLLFLVSQTLSKRAAKVQVTETDNIITIELTNVRSLLHVTVGIENEWVPTQEELEEVLRMFSTTDPSGDVVIATRTGIKAQVLPPQDDCKLVVSAPVVVRNPTDEELEEIIKVFKDNDHPITCTIIKTSTNDGDVT